MVSLAINNLLSTVSIIFLCATLLIILHETGYDNRKVITASTVFVLALNMINLAFQILL